MCMHAVSFAGMVMFSMNGVLLSSLLLVGLDYVSMTDIKTNSSIYICKRKNCCASWEKRSENREKSVTCVTFLGFWVFGLI